MPNNLGEELAYIQGKAQAETVKAVGKGLWWILSKMIERAQGKHQDLKGGECNLKKLMDSKSALGQMKIDEKHLKDLMQESKKFNVPIAVIKTVNNDYKIWFKQEEAPMVQSILEDLIAKQLRENKKVIDGITVEKSTADDRISFTNEQGQQYIGSIKDRPGTVKGLQEELGLKPKEALKVYIEATKVEAKDVEVTKSKRAGKICFKDSKGREYTASLDSKKETVIKSLQRTFGLDEKTAEKLYNKAQKQNVKGKVKEAIKTSQQQVKEPRARDKGRDKGDR